MERRSFNRDDILHFAKKEKDLEKFINESKNEEDLSNMSDDELKQKADEYMEKWKNSSPRSNKFYLKAQEYLKAAKNKK